MLSDRPYRLFFPLGWLLCAVGIGHWLLHSLRLLPDYRPVFHVTAQMQGFVTCFVAGFLFTMIPRRLAAEPPRNWQLAIVAIAPVAATALAWRRAWVPTQLIWAAGAFVLLTFVATRLLGRRADRRGPNVFLWLPIGLGLGVAGALLTVLEPYLPRLGLSWHQLGQDLVLQAMPLALIVGAGGIVFPLMTRDEGPPDGFGPGDRMALLGHTLAAVILVLSFWVAGSWSLRVGLLLRAAVVLSVLMASAQLWRAPRRRGWNAWLIYACGWAMPAGLLIAAAWPLQQRAGLHVSFIAGVALLALAVAAQVSFGHGGRREEILGRPVMVPVVAALVIVATAARAAMEIDPQRYFWWMQVAAVTFLAALVLWGVWVAPAWRRPRAPDLHR
jgi:uncharacterized protein involved in response to NO